MDNLKHRNGDEDKQIISLRDLYFDALKREESEIRCLLQSV
jgi:hypothetical protein